MQNRPVEFPVRVAKFCNHTQNRLQKIRLTAIISLNIAFPRTPRRRGHGGRRAAAAERCLFDAIGLI
ncbi:hypothetical protein HMPREF0372_02494 [Flavonifractor plautii ATCC 29863]|uniref:Uncharacterized protein n=1 Tax=Flavonifractor plautii ATCC 29863 TaxID=411475 RepID=G9YSI7_FLAPL|nr:hypothetical protein HMPREF0372_02494 [Flavonifractor plautii ATCC 29863]